MEQSLAPVATGASCGAAAAAAAAAVAATVACPSVPIIHPRHCAGRGATSLSRRGGRGCSCSGTRCGGAILGGCCLIGGEGYQGLERCALQGGAVEVGSHGCNYLREGRRWSGEGSSEGE